MKTAALDLARERQAHEAGARTRATAHERTPQQERQKAAREAERGREAWTLGQGMKKPVAGCYGRLMRWKGGYSYFPSFRAGLLKASLQIHRSITSTIFKGKLLFFLKH